MKWGAILGAIFGTLFFPINQLIQAMLGRVESDGGYSLMFALTLGAIYGLIPGFCIGFVWGLILGMTQAAILIGLEKLQRVWQLEQIRYRTLAALVSMNTSASFALVFYLLFVPYLGDKELLPDSYLLFLPSIVATITFAIIAVKTVSWVEKARKEPHGEYVVVTGSASTASPSAQGDEEAEDDPTSE
jgi:hypothetical protein